MGSVLREAHIAKLSRWNPQVPGEIGVTTTSRDEAIDRNSGELSIAKVEAVEGLVLPEPLMAVGLSSSTTMEVTFLDDQGGKQCALETASSPSDKTVAVDRRAPVPLAPSSKDGLCGSGAKVIKRPAYSGSSEHQDNDPTKQLPTFRRPPRRRSMAATPRSVLTQGSTSVCADASEFRCENVVKDAYSKLAVSSGVRHQSVSGTFRQSNVLPPASSGDVPEQGTVVAEKGSVGSRHETKRDDSLSTACCTSESLRIEVSKKKPAVRRSTRRRSMGVVSKGESVVLPLRARGIQCAETCAPPKAVARAESREKTVGSMESAVGCNLKEDRVARQEYGSTQGALVCADSAGGAAPQSSSRWSACHMYAKSGAPNSRSSETTRGKENCSPRTSSILEADDPGKGGHCGVIADVVQECMSRVEGVGVKASTGLEGKIEPLPSLLAAIEAAEACCMKHERLSSPGTGELHTTEARKGVCAVDLSAVDMPRDTTDGSQIPGSAQRTDEGNQVRLAPTCLKLRFSQNKTIRMSRDRETTGEDDTTRAASATNTTVSGVETVRTNSSRRMAIFSRRMIRAARQKKVHERMWASAGNVMSQSEFPAVTSNVVRKPRPPDARHRPVLHACSTKSGNHNLESQSMGHVTSQGGEREGISSPALTQTCCEEAASVPLGLQQECVSTTSQMVSSEKDAHDPFEVGMRVPMTTSDQFSLSTVKQGINDERDSCVGFDPVDDDAREFPVEGRHLPGCLPPGPFVVKSTEMMSPFLQRASVQELTTAVSATRSAGNDSNGLQSADLRCSPATATATPLDHTPAAEFVRGTGPWDVADAPVRSVDGEINHAQTEVSNPGKSDPTRSDQLKNAEALAREPQHRESDALDIFPSVYLVPKGEQCEGVVATALSDASAFTGGSGGPASDITRKYSALHSSEEYGPMDVVVAEGNGTASSVPRDVSPAGAGVGAVLTTKITGLEENNCGGASNVEVGSCIAVETLQPFRTSSEIGAIRADGDACEANVAAGLRERSPVDRLCDTNQGAPMATASYCSVLRETHIAKLSRWNPQVPDEIDVTTTTRDEATGKNSGELSVAKVEAVKGLVLPEPLMATFLDQGGKQCALETASSPAHKAVAVDRRAPVPLAPSSKDGLCGSGVKVIKRPAHPGSSEHQDNDPTKQLPTFRRSTRRRSMAATPRSVLTQGSASVCTDASEFRCENVAKDACSKLAVSSGVRHQSVSGTIRQSNVLPPAPSGDVPEQETVLAEQESVGSRHATKRDDSLSTACCTSESLSIEVSKKKPAVRRSTRRRSMGVVSKGESVVLPLRARGIQCAETCGPPKAVTRAESREKTVGSMESAVGCNLKEDRVARQEYGSTQGALVCADNAGGAAPQSSSRRSACHLYAKSGAPNSHSSETTRGKENCSPRTSSILEADDPGKGGHCGVIADVVQECMSRVEGVGVEASTGLEGKIEPLPSLLAAIEAAEACCMKHERLSSPGTGELHTTEARKRVRFCAFDLSAIDMPRDTTDGSQIPAEDIARCLNRVVEAQSVVREALRARSNGYKEWGAFLRELRALTVHGKSEIIVTGRGCERSRGDEETTKPSEVERREAARFLLAELEPLETSEGPVHTALGEKLGNFLLSLVRFKLRTLFNPPPEKLSKADNDVSDKTRFSGRSTGVAGPSHFSKVHEMVELGQGQPNATLTKALRRLYGYPGESAAKSVAEAEGFLAEATHRRWAFDTATLAEEARRHLIAIADIVDAVRARRFLRSLLELDVVRVAITAAGGWSHVEALASNLKKVMGSADIHTPLTLLSDIEGLQRWLGNDDLWPFRAEEVLQQIFAFLAPVTENPRKRWRTANGAVELLREAALEAKHRLPFPAVNVVKGVTAAKAAVPMTQKGRSSDAGGDRSTKSKPSNASRKARRVRDEVMNHVDHDREKRGASRARPPRPTSSKKRHRRASIM
ncbi:unnamed protein product [Ascophyllum nodosum]